MSNYMYVTETLYVARQQNQREMSCAVIDLPQESVEAACETVSMHHHQEKRQISEGNKGKGTITISNMSPNHKNQVRGYNQLEKIIQDVEKIWLYSNRPYVVRIRQLLQPLFEQRYSTLEAWQYIVTKVKSFLKHVDNKYKKSV